MQGFVTGLATAGLAAAGFVPAGAVPAGAAAAEPVTRWVNVTLDGRQGSSHVAGAVISQDGRLVAFDSSGPRLVRGDTNGVDDVFVRDLRAARPVRVSLGQWGQANGPSSQPAISATGRVVAFTSGAWNLVPDDSNAASDVFVRDLARGSTARVSLGAAGQANGASRHPGVSGDGRYVVFESSATDLVPGDTNRTWDVFVRDRTAGTTQRVSVTTSGVQGNGPSTQPVISADGRHVVFASTATNLVPGDRNGVSDVVRHDLRTGTTRLVSTRLGGDRPSVSGDGRWVAFTSYANPRWTNVHVRDMVHNRTRRISVGAHAGVLSADGLRLSFTSERTGAAPGETNEHSATFVRDLRWAGRTTRVSVGPGDVPGNAGSSAGSLSGDGRHVVFTSSATNLVPGPNTGLMESSDAYYRGPLR